MVCSCSFALAQKRPAVEPIALIATTLTVAFNLVALLCAVVGIILWCFDQTRFLAPFVTFIPALIILGATGGSWGLGYLAAIGETPGMSDRPLWAWIIGLPLGSVPGCLIGLWLAHFFKSGLTSRWRQGLV